jgi:hypothetical protein
VLAQLLEAGGAPHLQDAVHLVGLQAVLELAV